MSRDTSVQRKQVCSSLYRLSLPVVLFVILLNLGIALIPWQPTAGAVSTPTWATTPGEATWNNGVPSFLFGSNDTVWQSGLITNPNVQSTVKAAGITLIRAPFSQSDPNNQVSDKARLTAIQQSGAQCLAILHASDPNDAIKVFGEIHSTCHLFEIGNEPDANKLTPAAYAAEWNAIVPTLRQQYNDPLARFIGPVAASPNQPFIRDFLTAVKNSPPDIVSWHEYPCTDKQTMQGCAGHIDFASNVHTIAGVIQSALGKPLPQAITEWNFDWKSGSGHTPNADSNTMTDFTQQALTNMMQAVPDGLIIANQFELASGTTGNGSLNMINQNTAQPMPQLNAMASLIASYRTSCSSGDATPTDTTSATPVATATASVTAADTATPSITTTAAATPIATATSSATATTAATASSSTQVACCTATPTTSTTTTASATPSANTTAGATPSATATSSEADPAAVAPSDDPATDTPSATATSDTTPIATTTATDIPSTTPTSSGQAACCSLTPTATVIPSTTAIATGTPSATATSSETGDVVVTPLTTTTVTVIPATTTTGPVTVTATDTTTSCASPPS